MTAPNTAAHSAGAICCPTEASARRHDARGTRATWIAHGGLATHRTPRQLFVLYDPPERRWTR